MFVSLKWQIRKFGPEEFICDSFNRFTFLTFESFVIYLKWSSRKRYTVLQLLYIWQNRSNADVGILAFNETHMHADSSDSSIRSYIHNGEYAHVSLDRGCCWVAPTCWATWCPETFVLSPGFKKLQFQTKQGWCHVHEQSKRSRKATVLSSKTALRKLGIFPQSVFAPQLLPRSHLSPGLVLPRCQNSSHQLCKIQLFSLVSSFSLALRVLHAHLPYLLHVFFVSCAFTSAF